MRRSNVTLAVALACLLAGKSNANPTGAEVVSGQVGIVSSSNELLITNSPGAIINWQSFSILPGELTRFIQQGASSSVLNRITGQDPSQILGALQSNGKVVLINPNGILFGAGARVDVNGLLASTLNLSNADFLAGKLSFSSDGRAADVVNRGAITTPSGGQVYLIGSSVTNGGVITTPDGDVVLAAGHTVDLADSNDPDVRVVLSAPGSQALNVGKVVAESGRVGIYGALVNQMGLVSANSAVAGANGKIVFKASGDALLGAGSVTTATGVGNGGAIEVTGTRVGLTGDAVVDVSGQTGGGTVLLGGDEHGANAAIQNAAIAYVSEAARVKADATQSGDGGKVVVWSDQQTRMYGNISARGAGASGIGGGAGQGGFVEVSSKGHLDFDGVVDLRAPSGTAGTLLLDPSDITIMAGPSSPNMITSPSAPFEIRATSPVSTLSTTTLQNQLALGNVIVSTASDVVAPSGGTITVASPLAWDNANTLRLQAHQGIAINAPITAASGTLSLETESGDIVQNSGPITAAAVSAVALNGTVTLTDPDNAIARIAGSSNALLGFSLVNSGSFTVGTVPGFGQYADVTGIASHRALGYGVVLQAPDSSAITIAASVNANDADVLVSAGTMKQEADGLISAHSLTLIADTSAGIGASDASLKTAVARLRTVHSAGAVYVSNSGDLTINTIEADGAINVTTSGTLTTPLGETCDCTPRLTGSSVYLAAGGSMLLKADASITATNEVVLHAGYDAASQTYTTADSLTVENEVSGSAISLDAGGAITVTGVLTGAVTRTPSRYASPPPPAPTDPTPAPVPVPTLTQCEATPSLLGCSAVLPSLSQCVATPTTSGCSAVLPSLSACSTNPTAAGCSAVLPTLSACVAAPTAAGCAVVLPTMAQCVAAPTLQGCSVVLPPVSACVANPAAPGCQVVVPPSINQSTPVVQAINQVVRTVSSSSSSFTDSKPAAPPATQVDKQDEKIPTDSKPDAKDNSKVIKNDPLKKLYCN